MTIGGIKGTALSDLAKESPSETFTSDSSSLLLKKLLEIVAVDISKACTIGISLSLKILRELVNLAKLAFIKKSLITGICINNLSIREKIFLVLESLNEEKIPIDITRINQIAGPEIKSERPISHLVSIGNSWLRLAN
tara:strand:+ start:1137 stop:1550 length:414 start_codon:yes stop_codon:yes gene_type:complete